MTNKTKKLNSNYVITKFLYLIIGITLTALLLPKGLLLMGISLPSIFSSVILDPIYPKIEEFLIIFSKIFLLIFFIINTIIMFVSIKKSQSKTFFSASILFSLILPAFYIAYTFFNFLYPLINFIDIEFFNFAVITIILGVLLFLIGIILLFVKEKENAIKATFCDIVSTIFIIAFNCIFLIAYKNLFSLSTPSLLIITEYVYLAIYTLIIGLIQIIFGSKKFMNLK